MKPFLIVYVCVNYKSPRETLAHLEQLQQKSTQSYAVVVVENSPTHYAELDNWVSHYPDNHRYLVSNGNVGYLNGLGIGVRCALRDWPKAEWVVLSNVDLTLDASEFEHRLLNHLVDTDIGVVGPRIISSMSRQDQNPFLEARPTLVKMHIWRAIYRSNWIGVLYQLASDLWRHCTRSAWLECVLQRFSNCKSVVEKQVYAVHGSIFCLRTRFIREAGELEWPCFLFGEEIWIAELARRLGMRVLYDPAMSAEHREHITTASLSLRGKIRWHYQSINWLIKNYWTKV